MDPNGALARWFRELANAAEAVDRPIVICQQLKKVYEEVGFVDVHEKVFKIPFNGWPKDENLKELGKMWERNFQSGLSGFSLNLFNRAFSRTAAQTEVCEAPFAAVIQESFFIIFTMANPVLGCISRRETRTLGSENPFIPPDLGCLGTKAFPRRGQPAH